MRSNTGLRQFGRCHGRGLPTPRTARTAFAARGTTACQQYAAQPLLVVDLARQAAGARDRNVSGLFGHHHYDGVGLLRKPEGGAVARAQERSGIDVVGERKKTSGGLDRAVGIACGQLKDLR